MLGVVDVGGGLRGIYGAGVLDFCIDENIKFDYGIGVSAGAANIVSYIAGQKGRNYDFYTNLMQRKACMGWGNFIFKHTYIDMDYLYGTLSLEGGDNPLNHANVMASPTIYKVVATEAATGNTVYFDKKDLKKDNFEILKASSSIPVVCKMYPIDGKLYCDGGVSDPVPVLKALEDGCEKVVIILTKPADIPRQPGKEPFLAKFLKRKYPNVAKQLITHHEKYNEGVRIAKELEKEGKVLIISPDDCCGVDTLTKDKIKLDALHKKGYEDGKKILDFIK